MQTISAPTKYGRDKWTLGVRQCLRTSVLLEILTVIWKAIGLIHLERYLSKIDM